MIKRWMRAGIAAAALATAGVGLVQPAQAAWRCWWHGPVWKCDWVDTGHIETNAPPVLGWRYR